jgi:hypothetical protein
MIPSEGPSGVSDRFETKKHVVAIKAASFMYETLLILQSSVGEK